jgi:cellulose biosynthesis protein BcsQ
VRLFLATLKDLQENGLNDNLKLLGILLVQFDGRTIAHKQALEDLKGEGLDVLGIIPKGIKVQESSGAQKLLIDYDPNGKPTAAYFEAAERIKQCLK